MSEVPCQKKKASSGGTGNWRNKSTLSRRNVERSEKMVETGVRIPVIPAHEQTGNFISKEGKIIIKAEDDKVIC